MTHHDDPSLNSTDSTKPATRTIQVALLVFVALAGFALWRGVASFPAPKEKIPASSPMKANQQPTEIVHTVPRPSPPSENYIGSQACALCHPQIAARYERSAMGRTLAKVNETSLPHEDYDHKTSFDRGNRSYRVEKSDGRVWHHESVSDDEGVIYDQTEEIQYAMGSNSRGRSYLLSRDGAMFMSPISWYSKEGWDLSPMYPPDRHVRFSRRITDACLICHSGRVSHQPGREHYFPQPVFYEESIGCERCHGPGEDHAAFRRQDKPDGVDPILLLSELPPAVRDAVCYQCHFQGEERILRYGRSEADFRPGMKFSDVWSVFMKGNGANGGSTIVVSQAMQMHSSRCYQSSGARLGCVSCHDPHESQDEDNRIVFFDRRCLSCHEKQGCSLPNQKQLAEPANGSCIHCHMPRLSASNIPHTSQTDHRIPRNPDRLKSASSSTEYTMFEEAGIAIPEIERVRAKGLLKSLVAEKQRDRNSAEEAIKLLEQSQKSMPDDEAIQQALGGALLLSGRQQAADTLSKKMVKQFPLNEVALLRLANATHDAGHYTEAEEYFAPLMELNPWMAVTHGRRAHALGMLSRFDSAFEEAERALKLDPTILPLYGWLAEAHGSRGNREKSLYYKHQADRLIRRLTPTKPK